MAKVTQSRAKTFRKKVKGPDRIEVTFPDEPSEVAESILDYSMLLYGEMKIGKTSLLEPERAFFLECDPEQRGLRLRQRHIPSWRHFMAYLDELWKVYADTGYLPHDYPVGVIDRVDILYQHCYQWCVKNKLGGIEPQDHGGYEKANAWALVRQTFHSAINRFLSLPWGVRFICHGKYRIEDGKSDESGMYVPSLPGIADSIITGQADIIACYQYDGEDRILTILADDVVRAGHRCDEHFFVKDSDERVRDIWMGRSKEEAHDNLLAAFNNEQPYATMEERRESRTRRRKTASGKKKGLKVHVS